MVKKSNIQKNWPKYLLQWGTLAFIAAFVMGAFPSIENFDIEGLWPKETWELRQILSGIAILVAITLFCKIFCGYLCPLGTAQDFLIRLRGLMNIKSIKVKNSGVADKILRIFKYGLLFVVIYLTTEMQDLNNGVAFWLAVVSASIIIFGGFIVDFFWCRYICPLGAIFNSLLFWTWIVVLVAAWYVADALGAGIPWLYCPGAFCIAGYLVEICHGKPFMQILHVTKDEVSCNNCGECVKMCPFHIDLRSFHNGKVDHMDCTLCGECIASCHSGALNIGAQKPNKNRIWNLLPPILALAIIGCALWIGGLF